MIYMDFHKEPRQIMKNITIQTLQVNLAVVKIKKKASSTECLLKESKMELIRLARKSLCGPRDKADSLQGVGSYDSSNYPKVFYQKSCSGKFLKIHEKRHSF